MIPGNAQSKLDSVTQYNRRIPGILRGSMLPEAHLMSIERTCFTSAENSSAPE